MILISSDGGKTQAIAKKVCKHAWHCNNVYMLLFFSINQQALSVITTVSKLVVPKYMADPIVGSKTIDPMHAHYTCVCVDWF